MRNNTPQHDSKKTAADEIFDGFSSGDLKGIFARIPTSLHDEVLEIKAETGKSIYAIVERALRLFIAEYQSRKGRGDS